ncbi:Succinyl-CoA--L-malate CoA-transferase beta subunit [Zhongshania aliphaticivorans]|uniref:Succinyl-CoA--L-malate CoA-transferase beta subunit n=1 Tax=Zhongshania aliphaticivorans TaxID=1470434 RepID=A0A5S9NT43_9GAMM|nr:CaiB/BaiF CoA-transferase family protein [Zhongshania aliphaticivorans]CAA0093750.1 Succinyl-CoA--L-malate CoA-transferase beta subunit [Zhongshania aliphaticivorans]CAA0111777.1 Succinyl-CoA--L-malate CoA-transferase beta subunit [Zhongshania aliphaticivorans]
MSGPLQGLRVIEMAGIGPAPYACMLLSDLGAEVIRIDRINGGGLDGHPGDVTARGRQSIAVNLKDPEGIDIVLQLIASADVLVECYRPGVMEKLGLGPEVCGKRNPRLIYGRMTGWGQDGPMAKTAGHDINYIAISGLLASFGAAGEAPPTPLNVIGDLGGGSMFLLLGILAALQERHQSGLGQVIDAAICDGTASLLSTIHGLKGIQFWANERENNVLDGGAPFYRSYLCRDGRSMSVGAIEPHFYSQLLETLDLDFGGSDYSTQMDKAKWPAQRAKMAAKFLEKTRDEWAELFSGSDACAAPVLDLDEAESFSHNAYRKNLIRRDKVLQSAPAPRFSRTPGTIQHSPVAEGENTLSILASLGMHEKVIADMVVKGVIKQAE